MVLEKGYIHFIKEKHHEIWNLIKKTSEETGLILIDEENDAITATNRLLWTNPCLHECLSTMVNEWTNDHVSEEEFFQNIISQIYRKAKENDK